MDWVVDVVAVRGAFAVDDPVAVVAIAVAVAGV